jgi:hypothetical protein
MSGGVAASGTGGARTAQLARAYDEVAAVLEHVDLGEEPELAEETIAALAALDRAIAIAEGEH